ncbi:MAG TPA: type II toxin-antitoxin system VapC family toxin [Gammaproteobacteria bacterium]|nr:type II toxin-antitoxin system VapC family toxin [Gammaproteobacteria bacterium]
MVVLDTCAMIEACQKYPGFSTNALKQMEAGAYLLSISFAEIACKIKFSKLEMSVSLKDLYNECCQIETLKIVDIGVREWVDSIELPLDFKDPADRIIVAFASQKHLPIVTSDRRIKQFYKKVIW